MRIIVYKILKFLDDVLRKFLYFFLTNALTLKLRFRYESTDHVAILIQSFDGYKRFWLPAVHSVVKSMPKEVPIFFAFERYEQAEELLSSYAKRISFIRTGKGSFGYRAYVALKKLPSNFTHIIYFQEDMWPTQNVSINKITNLVKLMNSKELISLKLCKGAFLRNEDNKISKLAVPEDLSFDFCYFGKRQYCMSHHITMFHRDFFKRSLYLSMIFSRTSPFEHEYFISNILQNYSKSKTSDKGKVAIGVYKKLPVIKYIHASEKGALTHEAREWLTSEKVAFNEKFLGEIFPYKNRI